METHSSGILVCVREPTDLPVHSLALVHEAVHLVSFSLAMTITWALNRKLTFKEAIASSDMKLRAEYFSYLAIQVAGALINYGVFCMFVVAFPASAGTVALPLAIGAVFGFFFNFVFSRCFVYGYGRGKDNEV